MVRENYSRAVLRAMWYGRAIGDNAMISIYLEYQDKDGWVGKEVEVDVDADMSLSDETIDQDMCALPRIIAYYAQLGAELYAQAARYKQRMEETEARASITIRRDASETGTKITEPGIKERVIADQAVGAARNTYYKMEAQFKMMDGFYRALREKASLAIAICYKQKEEIRVMNSPLT